ncbi:MAG: GIY-YIG nuclease family protein [Candidatus Bathyarchaeota archaeon]|nr:GIY-YIG nuclease family protein [Candidatus Bathyarchaeota archaeon]
MKIKRLNSSQLKLIPAKAGIYIFYDSSNSPLYIGKALNLRDRVRNHFRHPTYKDNYFINKVKNIGYISLESGVEALILESRLIKKSQPKFNVSFRDDKKYFYVGVTQEKWPRIFLTHQPKLKNYQPRKIRASFIGPFTEGTAIKQTLRILRMIFPYRGCKKLQRKPCLWYQLSRCPAPCLIEKEVKIRRTLEKETQARNKEYKKNIKRLMLVLKGEKTRLISILKKEMESGAKLENFEKAARRRDQIKGLQKIFSHKDFLVEIFPEEKRGEDVGVLFKKALHLSRVPRRIEGYDVSNIRTKWMVGSMVVLKLSRAYINRYIPDKSQYRKFKIKTVKVQNDIACLKEIIKRRLRHDEWRFPDLVFVDGGKAQLNAAKKAIGQLNTIKFSIISLAKRKNLLYNLFSKYPLPLDKLPEEVKMTILRLRDESHRFAISYHKKLRERNFTYI